VRVTILTDWLSVARLTGKKVALKEIRLQPEEGTPFTAIREGEKETMAFHSRIR